MSTTEEIIAEVRQVVAQHAHLAQDAGSLAESDSLYAAGMTSHASVNVMLGVEDAFDLEFPEQMLTKETFESLESIASAVRRLRRFALFLPAAAKLCARRDAGVDFHTET